MVLLSYGNQNRPELLTESFLMYHPMIQNKEGTQYKLHRSIVSFDILHQLEEKISVWDRMKRVMSQVLKETQTLEAYEIESYKYCIIITGSNIKISKTHRLLNKILLSLCPSLCLLRLVLLSSS